MYVCIYLLFLHSISGKVHRRINIRPLPPPHPTPPTSHSPPKGGGGVGWWRVGICLYVCDFLKETHRETVSNLFKGI